MQSVSETSLKRMALTLTLFGLTLLDGAKSTLTPETVAHWVLSKLGGRTGQPVIVASTHPDYKRENFDIQIGQACFEKNWRAGRLQDIAAHVSGLVVQEPVFAFVESLHEDGISLPEPAD